MNYSKKGYASLITRAINYTSKEKCFSRRDESARADFMKLLSMDLVFEINTINGVPNDDLEPIIKQAHDSFHWEYFTLHSEELISDSMRSFIVDVNEELSDYENKLKRQLKQQSC
jgi:hypothetical protein